MWKRTIHVPGGDNIATEKWLDKAVKLEAESLETEDSEVRDKLRRIANMSFRRACGLGGDPFDGDVLT